MSFKDQAFSARIGSLGNEAESAFERNWPRAWDRYGLNRPRSFMGDMPFFVKHTPDYVTSRQLVECAGCGRDGEWKIKLAKTTALTEWQEKWEVVWFLWDGANKRYAVVDHGWVKDRVIQGLDENRVLTFPEGNAYVAISVGEVASELWTPDAEAQ